MSPATSAPMRRVIRRRPRSQGSTAVTSRADAHSRSMAPPSLVTGPNKTFPPRSITATASKPVQDNTTGHSSRRVEGCQSFEIVAFNNAAQLTRRQGRGAAIPRPCRLAVQWCSPLYSALVASISGDFCSEQRDHAGAATGVRRRRRARAPFAQSLTQFFGLAATAPQTHTKLRPRSDNSHRQAPVGQTKCVSPD